VDDGKGAKAIQKYNRHWAMVMHPKDAAAGSDLMEVACRSVTEVLPDEEDAKARGRIDSDMKRLVSLEEANHALGIGLADLDEYEELALKNIEAYYSGRPSAPNLEQDDGKIRIKYGVMANLLVQKLKELAAATQENRERHGGAQLDEAFPPAELGKELLAALTRKMAADSKTYVDALEVVRLLPDDFKKRLHSYF
jgi:transcription initiation factor TFIIH subunit 1